MNESAPVSTGTIVALQVCPGWRKAMAPKEAVEVIENFGIEGDRHARADSPRQILMIEKETLERSGLRWGEIKENITTANINLMRLKPTQRLQIGNDVILEVVKPCTPCNRMDEIRPGLRIELSGKRGMLFRVVHGGAIRVGDSIRVLI